MERRRYKAIESQTEAFEALDPLYVVDDGHSRRVIWIFIQPKEKQRGPPF